MCARLTLHVLHDHTQVSSGLKGAEHADHERVLGEGQDVSLHKRLLDLVPQNQVLFVDFLHSEALSCLQMADQIHRAEKHTVSSVSVSTLRVCLVISRCVCIHSDGTCSVTNKCCSFKEVVD